MRYETESGVSLLIAGGGLYYVPILHISDTHPLAAVPAGAGGMPYRGTVQEWEESYRIWHFNRRSNRLTSV